MKKSANPSAMISRLNTGPITLLTLTLISFVIMVLLSFASQRAYESRISLNANAQRFLAGSKTLTDEVRAYASTGERAHYDAYWYEINTAKNREIALEAMRAVGITDEEEDMIARMAAVSNNLVPLETQAMEQTLPDGGGVAVDYVYGKEYSRAIAEIREISTAFTRAIDERTAARVRMLNIMLDILAVVTGLLIIGVVLMQLKNMRFVRTNLADPMMKIRAEMQRIAAGNIMVRFEMPSDETEIGQLVESIKNTKRNLRKYVGDISRTLKLMAEGDLDTSIDIDYIGDFEPIKQSLDGILDSLNDMIGRMRTRITETAEAVTERAQSLQIGADELAAGSNEQARTIESLSASVSELAEEMHSIADSASHSHMSTSAAATELAESSAKMQDMQAAMNEISASSDGIKKITEAIGNIGSRTNIVAINAAIEAAKAGDVGRGFAVVADEVRNLAILCGEASRDTNALLDSTMKSVSRGLELTRDLTEAMDKLIAASRASSQDIADISEQSKHQAESLKKVASGFEQITAVVQENAATADTSAHAAKDLNTQAENLIALKEMIHTFKLRGSHTR